MESKNNNQMLLLAVAAVALYFFMKYRKCSKQENFSGKCSVHKSQYEKVKFNPDEKKYINDCYTKNSLRQNCSWKMPTNEYEKCKSDNEFIIGRCVKCSGKFGKFKNMWDNCNCPATWNKSPTYENKFRESDP